MSSTSPDRVRQLLRASTAPADACIASPCTSPRRHAGSPSWSPSIAVSTFQTALTFDAVWLIGDDVARATLAPSGRRWNRALAAMVQAGSAAVAGQRDRAGGSRPPGSRAHAPVVRPHPTLGHLRRSASSPRHHADQRIGLGSSTEHSHFCPVRRYKNDNRRHEPTIDRVIPSLGGSRGGNGGIEILRGRRAAPRSEPGGPSCCLAFARPC